MEEKAIRGLPWTLLTYATTRLLTVAITIILARLLTPADFGVVSLAIMVIMIVGIPGDLGLGSTLILRQDLDQRAQGTVFTLVAGAGAALTVLLAACSPLVADLFDEPRLAGVLALLSLTLLFNGLAWFYESLLLRELEFRRRFVAQASQSGIYAVSAVALAAAGAGVWSLVAGQLLGTLAYGAALLRLAPYWVRPGFDREVARDVFTSGRGFILQGGVAAIRTNADYLAVGRVLGAAQLGYYSMGYRLSELPSWGVADPVAKVTFPGFARMRSRGEEVGATFLSAVQLVALIACPLGVLLSATADPFTRAFFSDRWLPMIGPLSVLGVWGAIRPVQFTLGWFANSIGQAELSGRISAIVLAPLLVATFAVARLASVTGVAWVMLAEVVITMLAFAAIAWRRGGVPLGRQWRAVRAVLFSSVGAWVAARLVAESGAASHAGIGLAAATVAGFAVYFATLIVIAPGTLRRAARQMLATLGRASPATPSP